MRELMRDQLIELDCACACVCVVSTNLIIWNTLKKLEHRNTTIKLKKAAAK